MNVVMNGDKVANIALNPPSALPETDQRPVANRDKVVFSHYAWSYRIPWQLMTPGLSLEFEDNFGRTGGISANELEFAAPTQLIIQNIDIGMLTEPRNDYKMIEEMELFTRDYFQKIPTTRLIIADYTPIHLKRIVMPKGNIYTTMSRDNCSVYSGDLREDIGKSLISTGINNANMGIYSSAGRSQHYTHKINHITAHNSRGSYANGMCTHGLSGGGGIATLRNSFGNEWSHELVHNFARDHWLYNACVHDETTGWGWDSVFNQFIGNLDWAGPVRTVNFTERGQVIDPFHEQFKFTRDSMAGGESPGTGSVSNFTFDHPAGTKLIQNWLSKETGLSQCKSRATPFLTTSVVDLLAFRTDHDNYDSYDSYDSYENHPFDEARSQSAENKLNEVLKSVLNIIPTTLISDEVPVVTLLGLYDPKLVNEPQIHQPIYSNFGNIYSQDLKFRQFLTVEEINDLRFDDSEIFGAIVDDVDKPDVANICLFEFTSQKNITRNLIGFERHIINNKTNNAEKVCQISQHLQWQDGDTTENPTSQPGDYLLSVNRAWSASGWLEFDPFNNGTTYIACLPAASNFKIKKGNSVGFYKNGACNQIEQLKFKDGRAWFFPGKNNYFGLGMLKSDKDFKLMVTYNKNEIKNYTLPDKRYNKYESNKFHINVPLVPLNIKLIYTDYTQQRVNESVLAEIDVEENIDTQKLKGPVIVGRGCEN